MSLSFTKSRGQTNSAVKVTGKDLHITLPKYVKGVGGLPLFSGTVERILHDDLHCNEYLQDA